MNTRLGILNRELNSIEITVAQQTLSHITDPIQTNSVQFGAKRAIQTANKQNRTECRTPNVECRVPISRIIRLYCINLCYAVLSSSLYGQGLDFYFSHISWIQMCMHQSVGHGSFSYVKHTYWSISANMHA